MKCPNCLAKMQFEKSDYCFGCNTNQIGDCKVMPQTHYYCDSCDSEWVRTAKAKPRLLDGGRTLEFFERKY